ncbi:unnamed protein product [Protopolystoma xenopodis]|uniref:Replication factor A C-terminal domain-containing protein n=1 Tax=Protopolystoma xenopodis TaxID=117903 RepID=A0A448WN16_9PLAT|nr:unnamed protein product [Protopolystoma xenopodis]
MSGDQWVTCFQDSAEVILQATANDLGALKEAQDEQRLRVVASEVKVLDTEDYCTG